MEVGCGSSEKLSFSFQAASSMPLSLDHKFKVKHGTSLAVQRVRLCAPNAGGLGSIPGRGTRSRMHASTKSPHATTKKSACRN